MSCRATHQRGCAKFKGAAKPPVRPCINKLDLFEAAFYVIILFRWFGFTSHIGYRRLDGFAAPIEFDASQRKNAF